ncbi:hypothetical protein ER57_00560 [Smithella sp. SCADC]|nr:hypothetical protein ER57_00560 [Smithella sp. SCADC]
MYRGLTPHKFTPLPGVHQAINPIAARWAAPGELFVPKIPIPVKFLLYVWLRQLKWLSIFFMKYFFYLHF